MATITSSLYITWLYFTYGNEVSMYLISYYSWYSCLYVVILSVGLQDFKGLDFMEHLFLRKAFFMYCGFLRSWYSFFCRYSEWSTMCARLFFWFCKCCSKTAVIGIIIYHVSTCMISLLKIALSFCALFRAHIS